MTAANNLAAALQLTLYIEGPMTDDKVSDPNGGLTKYGISQIQNPNLDVRNLTQAQAEAYYIQNYWHANSCDQLPWPVCYVLFDIDVNNGDKIGAKLLQRSLGITDDGVVGLVTVKAVLNSNLLEIAMRAIAKRGVYYTELANWKPNAEGWMYRNAKVAYNCALDPLKIEPKTAASSGG